MAIKALLEVEQATYKSIYALRHHYQYTAPIHAPILVQDILCNRRNAERLSNELRALVTAYAPFDIYFTNPHRATASQTHAVKYCLQSPQLNDLRRDLFTRIADATVFDDYDPQRGLHGVSTLRKAIISFPRRFIKPICMSVKAAMDDEVEASRIFEEVSKIEPQKLGHLRAIGVRIRWQTSKSTPEEDGEPFLFTGKS